MNAAAIEQARRNCAPHWPEMRRLLLIECQRFIDLATEEDKLVASETHYQALSPVHQRNLDAQLNLNLTLQAYTLLRLWLYTEAVARAHSRVAAP